MRLNGVQEVVGSNPAGPIAKDVIKMYYVYVLRSFTSGIRYVGSCADPNERLRRHNAGHSKATRSGKPWVMVHSEPFATRAEAMSRERYLKSGRGRDELDRLTL